MESQGGIGEMTDSAWNLDDRTLYSVLMLILAAELRQEVERAAIAAWNRRKM
jgi:hypothetical protein